MERNRTERHSDPEIHSSILIIRDYLRNMSRNADVHNGTPLASIEEGFPSPEGSPSWRTHPSCFASRDAPCCICRPSSFPIGAARDRNRSPRSSPRIAPAPSRLRKPSRAVFSGSAIITIPPSSSACATKRTRWRRRRRYAKDPAQLPLYGVPVAIKDNIDVAGLADHRRPAPRFPICRRMMRPRSRGCARPARS